MLNSTYKEYIYQVDGEKIQLNPKNFFDPIEVYLIIDVELKTIWIWAGDQSRLFHRYMAATWAGKLKSKPKYYNYKYEVIKEGREPQEFISILEEIKTKRSDLSYPGQSRASKEIKSSSSKVNSSAYTPQPNQNNIVQAEKGISSSEKSRIKKILLEIKEREMQIRYSIEHIEKRIIEIEKIIEK